MKILLVVTMLFYNGVSYTNVQEVENYDDCFVQGQSIIKEIQAMNDESILEVKLECI